MASPKKVNSISLTASNLTDRSVPITEFDRATLLSFLNTVSSTKVAVFFSGEGSDNGFGNRLVIASVDGSGNPTTQQTASETLPCPPYCVR